MNAPLEESFTAAVWSEGIAEVNLPEEPQEQPAVPLHASPSNAQPEGYRSYVDHHNHNEWRTPSTIAALITAVAALITACTPFVIKLLF
ncbi:hypothetical protein ABZ733_29895 [Streptomyces longwoodensis]|uniref:hypothetical protein n=1 Tax=Streptomyces longwoodensis TaxID=68231 RepID=UPI0033DAB246